jgi:hypothetical protein
MNPRNKYWALHIPHQRSGVHLAKQNVRAQRIWNPEVKCEVLDTPHTKERVVYTINYCTAYTTNDHGICCDPG